MRLSLLVALSGFATGGCTHPGPASPAATSRIKTDYRVRKDTIYTPTHWALPLAADIYLPEGPGPNPGVLLVYGGSWSSTDHRWQMTLLARKLAQRGYVVMSARYRGTPEYRYPAPLDDLRQALRWLRGHASELRLRSDKVAIYGFSAGGHLAALVGVTAETADLRPQAVVAVSAPLDLTLDPTGTAIPRFLGATFAENPNLYREASPIAHVTQDDPPFFLYHGTNDKTVSPEHTRLFKAALDRAHVRNVIQWVEGRGHAAMLIRGGVTADAAIDFLDAVLR
jgi:acetyl esterase/lipase